MSSPIIGPTDVGTYLGVDTTDTDTQARLTYVISLAQTLCEAIVSPLPAGAAAVVIDVVTRAFLNPGNATSESTGPFPVNWGAVSGGLWLTRQNKATLRVLAGLTSGAFSIDMTPDTAATNLPWWDANIPIGTDDIGWYWGPTS